MKLLLQRDREDDPEIIKTVLPGMDETVETVSPEQLHTEQVKDLKTLHLIFIVKDIEKTLLGKVSRRPCLVTLWRQDGLSSIFSSYNPHNQICSTFLK